MALLCCDLPFSRFVFSVQAEVADRMLANEGSRDFGPLSIVLQSTCSLEKLFHLPPQVFWPAPEVDSVVLRLDINRANFASPDDLRAFGEFVRAAFGHRRKTLNYNLSRTVDPPVLRSLGESLEIDLRQRPEQIPVRKWLEMYFRLNLKSRES